MEKQTNPATETPWQRRVRFLKSQSDAIYAAESAKVSARMRDVDRAREELELVEAKLSVAKIESARRIHAAQDELSEAEQAASDAPSSAEIEALFARAARAADAGGFRQRPPRSYR